jgi:tripartite-type tricarboxylate transporter receptor subunit TctC
MSSSVTAACRVTDSGAFSPSASRAVATAARNPETRARFDALGAEPVADSPEDYARFVRAEYDRWGKLVRDARIKLD